MATVLGSGTWSFTPWCSVAWLSRGGEGPPRLRVEVREREAVLAARGKRDLRDQLHLHAHAVAHALDDPPAQVLQELPRRRAGERAAHDDAVEGRLVDLEGAQVAP